MLITTCIQLSQKNAEDKIQAAAALYYGSQSATTAQFDQARAVLQAATKQGYQFSTRGAITQRPTH